MKPSIFLPAPFAMLPGDYADFQKEAHHERCPVARAEHDYHLTPKADTWQDYCEKLAEKRVGLQVDAASGIAVQPVLGRLMDGISPEWEAYGSWFNTGRIADAARRAQSDRAIRALVLYVNSPGGYTPGVREAAAALQAVTRVPVAAYLKNATSAAIHVAAGCGSRHAPSSAELGGIGTFIVCWDSSKFYSLQGHEVTLITDGKLKGVGAEGVAWKKDWYDYLEARVMNEGKQMKEFIRAACPKVGDDLMQGQSYPASALRDAKAVGSGHLIDTCPDLLGNGGFPTFDDLLSGIAAQL